MLKAPTAPELRVVLDILQSDIANGKPGDCLLDPAAIALKRITGVPWRVDKDICYPVASGPRAFRTPKQLATFIEAFDDGKPVSPLRLKV